MSDPTPDDTNELLTIAYSKGYADAESNLRKKGDVAWWTPEEMKVLRGMLDKKDATIAELQANLDASYKRESEVELAWVSACRDAVHAREELDEANATIAELIEANTACTLHIAGQMERIAELEAELDERDKSFDLRHQSDMRAIAMWQKATGKELAWPSHDDLCVWLMQQNAELEARLATTWQPVEDDFIHVCQCVDCVGDEWRWQLYTNGDTLGICHIDDEDDDRYIVLPDNLRLCRKGE